MSDPSTNPDNWNRTMGESTEQTGLAILRAQRPRIELAFTRLNDGGYMYTEPRSTLALDDPYLGQWREGALHRVAMSAAVDGLLAVQSIIEGAADGRNKLPMTALYPILRSIIENASLALYLIEAEDRDERLFRSFQSMADDANRARQHRESRGIAEAQAIYEREIDHIDTLIAARPMLSASSARRLPLPKYTDLVKGADALLLADPALDRTSGFKLIAFWQLLSGLSHGRAWAMVEALERSNAVVDPATRTGTVTMTTSVAAVAAIMQRGLELVESVVRLYGRRSTADHALPADADEPWA